MRHDAWNIVTSRMHHLNSDGMALGTEEFIWHSNHPSLIEICDLFVTYTTFSLQLVIEV